MAPAKLKPSVLTPEGLQHIADHKYVAGSYTPLDNFLNPGWVKLCEALPAWLAPNLVTLIGFVPILVSYVLAWRSSPHFSEAPPRPIAFFAFSALLFYQTMDALDGKQARRTGSSSPLGQLFDHGCDCLACISHHSMSAMFLLPGPSMWTLGGLCALQAAFFLAQWQEYHTGVLSCSFGPVGVTETQFALMFGVLTVGVVGPERIEEWVKIPVQPFWASNPLPLGLLGIQGWIGFICVLIAISLSKVMSLTAANGTLGKACAQLVSPGSLCVLMFLWEPSSCSANVRKIVCLTGLLFFFYTSKMILFSMAKMEYPTLHWDTLIPYAAFVAMSWLLSPTPFACALAAATLLFGFRVVLWLWAVLEELKGKLQILVFSLRKRD